MNQERSQNKSANPDPLTGEPGAHPVGTGLGAAGGGAATGAIVGTVAGPVGTAVGAAAGAVVGGLVGKGVAESVNPTHANRLVGYDVEDIAGDSVGSVESVWTSEQEEPVFLGVKAGWLFGKSHVVPAHAAQVNEGRRLIRLPYTEAQIKAAPAFAADAELERNDIQSIYAAYDVDTAPTATRTSAATATSTTGAAQTEATLPIREESLIVGKRDVEAGGVHVRKVVHTETVNQPVELRREDVVIERVAASEVRSADVSDAFQEKDVFIPLLREEAVVQRDAVITGAVRVRKVSHARTETIRGEVRKEDVEVDRSGEHGRSV